MSDYAHLLAAAARSYGGASPADWLSALAPCADAATRRSLQPLAEALAAKSGYDPLGPLFTGIPTCSSGIVALNRAHTAAFGTGLELEELLASGLHDTATLPGKLAERLALANQHLWRSALRQWQHNHLPAMSDGAAWIEAQTPIDYYLPSCVRLADRPTLNASLDTALEAAISAMAAQTLSALRIQRLPGADPMARAARCLDTCFLARYFRRTVWKGLETMRLHDRQIGKGGDHYLSYAGFRAWHRRQLDQQAWMRRMLVKDNRGKCKPRPLADVVTTNKAKRSRLLAVMTGIERLAVEAGLEAAMVTLTLPPAWHPNPSTSVTAWGGPDYAPDRGATSLGKSWASFLRDLDNVGVRIAGLRVVEAHKDGCPHMHILAYYRPEDELSILECLATAHDIPSIKVRTLITSPDGKRKTRRGVTYDQAVTHYDVSSRRELPGEGDTHRIEFSRVNRKVATAASYIHKYVAKGIDFDDVSETPAPDAATAAAAHASGWGYRRYAFFGIRSSLSLWDALRRAKELPDGTDEVGTLLWRHAHAGDYAEFLRILGGLSPASGLRVRAIYHARVTRYGDDVEDVVGLEVVDGAKVVLRLQIREPGRFELVEIDNEEGTLTGGPSPDDPPF